VYWCPVRREVVPFRVFSIESVAHVNYVPVGRSQREHFELLCPETGLAYMLSPDAPLQYRKGPPASTDDYAALLPIGLLEYAERESEVDSRLSGGPSQDRIVAVFTRVRDANYGLKRPLEPTETRLLLLVGFLFAMVVTISLAAKGSLFAILPGVLCASLVIALIMHEWGRNRAARFAKMRAFVIDSIRGTGADDKEIEVAIEHARKQRFEIARHIAKALREEARAA